MWMFAGMLFAQTAEIQIELRGRTVAMRLGGALLQADEPAVVTKK